MGNGKNKTRRIATKRFKLTKTGKIKRKHANSSHRARIDDNSTSLRKKREFSVTGKFSKKIKLMMGR